MASMDLQRRRVTIAQSGTPVHGQMVFGETKGHEHRKVPIVPFLIAEIEHQMAGKRFGHRSAAMTLDQYGHLFGDRLDVVADAMEAARLAELAVAREVRDAVEVREVCEGGAAEVADTAAEASTSADVYPLCTRPDLRVVGE